MAQLNHAVICALLTLGTVRWLFVPLVVNVLFRRISADLMQELGHHDAFVDQNYSGIIITDLLSCRDSWIVAALAAAMTTFIASTQHPWPIRVALCLFLWILLAIAVIDAYTTIIPIELSAPLIAGGLLASWAFGVVPFDASLKGAFLGVAIVLALRAVTGMINGHEGMGMGDGMLLAAIGAWSGARAVPMVLSMAASLAVVYAILRYLVHRSWPTNVAFAPALCTAVMFHLVLPTAIYK